MPYNSDGLYYRNADIWNDIKNFQDEYDEWEHINKEYITCPYCGYKDRDSWEYSDGNGSDQKIECGNCENEFIMSFEVEVKYSTEKLGDFK